MPVRAFHSPSLLTSPPSTVGFGKWGDRVALVSPRSALNLGYRLTLHKPAFQVAVGFDNNGTSTKVGTYNGYLGKGGTAILGKAEIQELFPGEQTPDPIGLFAKDQFFLSKKANNTLSVENLSPSSHQVQVHSPKNSTTTIIPVHEEKNVPLGDVLSIGPDDFKVTFTRLA